MKKQNKNNMKQYIQQKMNNEADLNFWWGTLTTAQMQLAFVVGQFAENLTEKQAIEVQVNGDDVRVVLSKETKGGTAPAEVISFPWDDGGEDESSDDEREAGCEVLEVLTNVVARDREKAQWN
jgi:hypothetical protein